MNAPIRILLVDDSPHFANAARDFLDFQESLTVVGVASEEATAVAQSAALQPDVILLDLNLGHTSGLTLIPQLKGQLPAAKIIVLSILEEGVYREAALRAGADAFVHKSTMAQNLVSAIRTAMQRSISTVTAGSKNGAAGQAAPAAFGMQRLAEHLPDLYYRYAFTPQRGFTYVNSAATAMTGYTPEDHYGDPDLGFKLIHPDDRHLLEGVAQGNIDPLEPVVLRWVRKDGSLLWTEQRNVGIFDEKGALIAIEGSARDVTARKQAEEALHHHEQELRTLIENSPDAITRFDRDGRYQLINARRAEYFGLPREAILGKSWRDLLGPEDEDEAKVADAVFRRVRDEGVEQTIEYETATPAGKRWVQSRAVPEPGTNGTVETILVFTRDITERKQAEAAVQASERFARETLDALTSSIAILDATGTIVAVNRPWRAFAQAGGLDPEQVSEGVNYLAVCDGATGDNAQGAPLMAAGIRSVIGGATESYSLEYPCDSPNEARWFMVRVTRFGSQGPVRVVVAHENITERKRAEEVLRLQGSALEAAANAIAITDVAGAIQWVNTAFTRLTGYAPQEVVGQNMRFLAAGQQDRTFYVDLWNTILAGRSWYGELINRRKDGSLYTEEQTITPIFDVIGVLTHFVGIKQDVSGRKLVEAQIRQQEAELRVLNRELEARVEARTAALSHLNLELERALHVKDEFLANMSHELRTPLSAIIGMAELLAERIGGPLTGKQQRYVDNIGESASHLLALINDILDLAKSDAGQLSLHYGAVGVGQVCQASLRMVTQLAHQKGQQLSLAVDAALDTVWADERRLKQMLVNLLGNAVKFTPERGRIGLEAHVDQDGRTISFTVWDNGIGIAEDDIPRLFHPFVQLDSQAAHAITGTGLGLALVAEMARLHGGNVGVESQTGHGSRFTITLPWLVPPLATGDVAATKGVSEARSAPPPAQSGHTILLVDDTNAMAAALRDYLEHAGYDVALAHNGVEAIAQAYAVRPALILMDVQMPVLDGLETTRRLRSDPAFPATPIIALTALALGDDRIRCLAAGMDDYLSKPVNLPLLLETIKNHIAAGRA